MYWLFTAHNFNIHSWVRIVEDVYLIKLLFYGVLKLTVQLSVVKRWIKRIRIYGLS